MRARRQQQRWTDCLAPRTAAVPKGARAAPLLSAQVSCCSSLGRIFACRPNQCFITHHWQPRRVQAPAMRPASDAAEICTASQPFGGRQQVHVAGGVICEGRVHVCCGVGRMLLTPDLSRSIAVHLASQRSQLALGFIGQRVDKRARQSAQPIAGAQRPRTICRERAAHPCQEQPTGRHASLRCRVSAALPLPSTAGWAASQPMRSGSW